MLTALTPKEIEEQLRKAASIMRRLPSVKLPKLAQPRLLFVRTFKDRWVAALENGYDRVDPEEVERSIPPTVNDMAGMDEALGWLLMVENIEDREILWARANGVRWSRICRRFNVSRKTAWQRWTAAILTVAMKLSGGVVPKSRSAKLKRRPKHAKLEPVGRV